MSYRFRRGAADLSPPSTWPAECFKDRTPVIAHGSNRAPEQLARKYPGDRETALKPQRAGADPQADEIPVTLTQLHDYEVVYSAHMTRYGAVAANLQHAPGAVVEVFITWLNAAQLQRMHDTELGAEIYRFGCLEDVTLGQPAGPIPPLERVFVYLSSAGCLRVADQPAGIAAVPAVQRRFPALSQLEALETVRHRLYPDRGLDEFILAVIAEAELRRRVIEALRADAVTLAAPHFRSVDPG
ncbi:hypothetical protein [Denitrobaculum tricleocarpae]|uniref:Uncharacterized protein n=1 Tax=Denitrobaculum tricleocarpae TaxID=2591009 RepID=A0A545U1V6_9PROT|nr:hypothetical protein [Denitrobaculum tricleocarpae]TQV83455.1 hypothetical protein FKG95_02360 [Denitrobaculum tricleocarpae]